MTYKEVANVVRSFGLPFAYYSFPEGTAQATPYVCYFYVDSDDVFADDTNYQPIRILNIELYTDTKDFDLESQIETILKANNLTYHKQEAYINSERMWQIAYEMEVVINE